MKKNYAPQPMDTSDIQLPEELNVLIEQMAKNVHEVWAQSRMEQGWTYGEERSDALKQHPYLIPYDELPEVEKAYDRDTALGTLNPNRSLETELALFLMTAIRKMWLYIVGS